MSDYNNLEEIWKKAYDLGLNFKYYSYNVSPGYDDTHVNQTFREKNLLRKVSRKNGETYKKTFQFLYQQWNNELPIEIHFLNLQVSV